MQAIPARTSPRGCATRPAPRARRRIACLTGALLGLALLRPIGVEAQTLTPEQDASYQRAVRDALQEYRIANFAEAYALFERAHQLLPSARTWRCLGMSSFELRQYVRAEVELRSALEDSRQQLTSAQRSEVTELLERVAQYVATLEVIAAPSSAVVTLDGHPMAGKVNVNLGEHELVVRADGYQPVQRQLDLQGGKSTTLEIELLALATAPAPAESTAQLVAPQQVAQGAASPPEASAAHTDVKGAAQRDTPLVQRWWFWTAIGAVAAGSVLAVVLATRDPQPIEPESGTVGETIVALGGRW